MSTFWLRSTMSRVWLSSPPRRASLATGNSLEGLPAGVAEPVRSAAAAPPTTNATSTNAKLVARTDMDFPALRAFLLHYGAAVNLHLIRSARGGRRRRPSLAIPHRQP